MLSYGFDLLLWSFINRSHELCDQMFIHFVSDIRFVDKHDNISVCRATEDVPKQAATSILVMRISVNLYSSVWHSVEWTKHCSNNS